MLHNSFTVTRPSGSVTSFNTLGNIFDAYKSGKAICAYIYIITDLAEGNSVTAYKAAVSVASNFDAELGALFATYETSLEPNELAGQTIRRIGFSYAESQAAHINACEFSLEKNAGERLVISGTLHLDARGENICLCGGKNALAEALLGAAPFPQTGYELAAGDCFAPSEPFEREVAGFTERVPAISEFLEGNGGGVRFSAQLSRAVNETLLLYQGKPVLRARPPLSSSVSINAKTAQQDGYIVPDERYITDVFNVKCNGETLFDYSLTYLPEALFRFSPREYTAELPGYFEHYGPFFLTRNGREAALLKAAKGTLIPYRYVSGDDVRLCDNGCAVLFSGGGTGGGGAGTGGSVRIAAEDSETGLSIMPGTKNEAVFMTDKYLIACWSSGRLNLYYVDRNFDITVQTVTYNIPDDDFHMINFGGHYIAVAARGYPVRVFSPQAEDTLRADWLNRNSAFLFAYLSTKPFFESGRLVFFEESSGYTACIDFLSDQITFFDFPGRVWDEFFVQNYETFSEIYTLDSREIYRVFKRIKRLMRQDNTVYLFFEDGSAESCVLSSDRVKLNSPSIRAGDSVSYYARYQDFQSGMVALSIVRS